jgi:hypothetical protein
MKIQNKGAVLVQIAPLFISQPRNQNQSMLEHPPTPDPQRFLSIFSSLIHLRFLAPPPTSPCQTHFWEERERQIEKRTKTTG